MLKKEPFVKPIKVTSLLDRNFAPAFDVLRDSPLMKNCFWFEFYDMNVACWPEMCIVTVDTESYHYWGFVEEVNSPSAVIRWTLRHPMGNKPLASVPFDERNVYYALGYCKTRNYVFEPKTTYSHE